MVSKFILGLGQLLSFMLLFFIKIHMLLTSNVIIPGCGFRCVSIKVFKNFKILFLLQVHIFYKT